MIDIRRTRSSSKITTADCILLIITIRYKRDTCARVFTTTHGCSSPATIIVLFYLFIFFKFSSRDNDIINTPQSPRRGPDRFPTAVHIIYVCVYNNIICDLINPRAGDRVQSTAAAAAAAVFRRVWKEQKGKRAHAEGSRRGRYYIITYTIARTVGRVVSGCGTVYAATQSGGRLRELSAGPRKDVAARRAHFRSLQTTVTNITTLSSRSPRHVYHVYRGYNIIVHVVIIYYIVYYRTARITHCSVHDSAFSEQRQGLASVSTTRDHIPYTIPVTVYLAQYANRWDIKVSRL